MDGLGWERNMPFQWSNINDHQHQEIQESFIGSQNIFMNTIQQQLQRTDPSTDHPTSSNPETAMSYQMLNSINVSSKIGTTGNWVQALASAMDFSCSSSFNNGFQDSKNVISISTAANPAANDTTTSLESLDCLLSGTNSNTDTSADHEDGISVLFSDCKNLWTNNIVVTNNNISGVSSGDSVTREIEDSTLSQGSSEKRPPKRSHADLTTEDNPPKAKRSRSDTGRPSSSNINFQQVSNGQEPDSEAIAQMKEMIYRAAAFRPVTFGAEEVVEKTKRKNVRISSDPQTVAARQRRERISERIRVLQRLVPGGNKMDTASMLDEAANYLKFLRSQVKALEQLGQKLDYVNCTTANAASTSAAIPNINPHASPVVPFTAPNPLVFPMHTHFPLPQQNLYPNPPPA